MDAAMTNLSIYSDEDVILDTDQDEDNLASTVSLISSICMSTCCLFGLYGNLVSALIFTHPIMKSPMDVLLCGLSINDLCLVILAIPVFVFPALNQAFHNDLLTSLYPYSSLILYPVTMMSQTCSIWTFVLVSIERYSAVCKPLMRHKLLTCKEAKYAQITVTALSFCYNLVRFWEYNGSENFSRLQTLLRDNLTYFYFYYTSLYEITHFVVPFFIILLLNAYILKSLGGSPRNLRRFTRSQMQQRKTSVMIVVITMMFAMCNLLPFLINIWEAVDLNLFKDSWRTVAFLISDVSNCLVVLNSSTTFMIYLMFCRKYRVLFRYYGRFRRPIGDGQYLLHEDHSFQNALVGAASFPLRATALAYTGSERLSSSDMVTRFVTQSSLERCENGT